MTSLDEFSRSRKNAYTVVYNGERPEIYLEPYTLKNTRDLRTLILDTAYVLQRNPQFAIAHIAIQENCTLSQYAVAREIEQFNSICKPDIASRLNIADLRNPHGTASLPPVISSNSKLSNQVRQPTMASQEAVIATLLQRYIRAEPGITMDELVEQTGAGLATAYLAINRHAECLEQRNKGDKRLKIKVFTHNNWMDWIERSNRLKSIHFVDHSGAPRSATRLAKDLARLQRNDLAIGGLMGAMHHLPGLDATAAPQLDILVHGGPGSDLSFIQKIDPGLKISKNMREPANVVVHFIDRPQSLFEQSDGQNWGALPDCLANMHRAHLTHQVEDAIRLIQQKRSAR